MCCTTYCAYLGDALNGTIAYQSVLLHGLGRRLQLRHQLFETLVKFARFLRKIGVQLLK